MTPATADRAALHPFRLRLIRTSDGCPHTIATETVAIEDEDHAECYAWHRWRGVLDLEPGLAWEVEAIDEGAELAALARDWALPEGFGS